MKSVVNAIVYSRTSSLDINKTGISIPEQIAKAKKIAKEKGIHIYKEISDPDTSSSVPPRQILDEGSRTKPRKGLTEALDLLISGKANCIITRDIDRLARKLKDNIAILELLKAKKISLVLTDSSIPDLATASGILALNMVMAVMQYHYDRSVEYGTATHLAKTSRGEKFGPASKQFGYDDGRDEHNKPVQNEIKVNEQEAEIVRGIFDRFAVQRWGIIKICRWLDTQKFEKEKAKRKRPINFTSVQRILKNPKYAGLNRLKDGDLIKSVWPLIVDREIWDKAQKILTDKPAYEMPKATVTCFTGLGTCKSCGSPLIAHRDKRTRFMRYYCLNRKCENKAVPMSAIEWERFLEFFAGSYSAYNASKKHIKPSSGLNVDEKRKLATLEKNLEELRDPRKFSGYPIDEIYADRKAIKKEIDSLKHKEEPQVAPPRIVGWNQMKAIQKNDALRSILSSILVGTDSVEVRLAGVNLVLSFPILQNWGTHKYKYSLLPHPYIIWDNSGGDMISGLYEDSAKELTSLNSIYRFCWTNYDKKVSIGRITVWRSKYDAPLFPKDVLLSMRLKRAEESFGRKRQRRLRSPISAEKYLTFQISR